MRTTVTLLTDFGDFYPGVMKGVILRINPNVKIVDISHHVEPQNVMQAAFLLANYYKFFENAVHVIVVDPGVGGKREALIVEHNENMFVAPNNGVLSLLLDKDIKVWAIDEEKSSKYTGVLSSTFHGRDVFAPAAALSTLDRFDEIVKPFKGKLVKVELFNPIIFDNKVRCNAVYIDRFGNVVTDLKRDVVEKLNPKGFYINNVYFPLVEKYEDVEMNEPLCLIGSFNTLEFSIRNGNASKKFEIKSGTLELEVHYE